MVCAGGLDLAISSGGDYRGCGDSGVGWVGGGLYNEDTGQTTLTGTQIEYNSASKGGGFYLENGSTLTLHEATISNNTAQLGNGICYELGAIYALNDSTVTDKVEQNK